MSDVSLHLRLNAWKKALSECIDRAVAEGDTEAQDYYQQELDLLSQTSFEQADFAVRVAKIAKDLNRVANLTLDEAFYYYRGPHGNKNCAGCGMTIGHGHLHDCSVTKAEALAHAAHQAGVELGLWKAEDVLP